MNENRICEVFEKELKKSGHFESLCKQKVYVGDIHNHCGISYGYGPIEKAISFAKAQLDFFSVTGHFAWPDMDNDSMLIPAEVKAYHRKGFAKLRENWPHYLECMKKAESSSLIPFPSYEFHSFEYGDYTVLCHDIDSQLPNPVPENQEDLRLKEMIEGNEAQLKKLICFPHHIGYKTGYRGINWKLFNEKISPFVEIASMHGCSESSEARLKYCHTMGPRCSSNTYQGGLSHGYHFGVTGSTDHHNAAPGSYGSGRTVLYAESLSRDSVWKALINKKIACATGDPIQTALFINGVESGAIAPRHNGRIEYEAYVAGYDKLEKVELIQDGQTIVGQYCFNSKEPIKRGFVSLMFGWGKKHTPASWSVSASVSGGKISCAVPRIRGIDMVDPLDTPADSTGLEYSFKSDKDCVTASFVTDGNVSAQTDSSDGFVIGIEGDDSTEVVCNVSVLWNGVKKERAYIHTLKELKEGQISEYVDGFVSPAVEFGAFNSESVCVACLNGCVDSKSQGAVYLRAYEKNGDAVYTSPVSFR